MRAIPLPPNHRLIADLRGKLQRAEVAHDTTYDCYYETKTGAWLEPKCNDANCEYCGIRPERHES